MLSPFTKTVRSLIVITTDLTKFFLTKFNTSKIFEKCTYTRSTNFLKITKLFFPHYFGFRSGYSTNNALTSLTEMIRKALDEGNFACGVFIDFQNAFAL